MFINFLEIWWKRRNLIFKNPNIPKDQQRYFGELYWCIDERYWDMIILEYTRMRLHRMYKPLDLPQYFRIWKTVRRAAYSM